MDKKEFVTFLQKKGALRIAKNMQELFRFKSGRMSPNFINIGALTDGESLSILKRAYAQLIFDLVKEGKIEKPDFIFGPAYKGISLAALACEGLYNIGMNVRYLYDRKESKDYGDMAADRVIVGDSHFIEGSSILIVDDVVTTGQTKLDSLDKLKSLGKHNITCLILALDRQEKMGRIEIVEDQSPVDYINSLGISTFSIVNMQDIFWHVKNDLSEEIRQAWIEYYDKYGTVKLG